MRTTAGGGPKNPKAHLVLVSEALALIESRLESAVSVPEITDHFEQSHWYFQRQ